ncbi:AAA family ATPase [Pseudomonas sp. nanlin1]|uniref:AAA family ATPase n=1 Tax=Pseudomonas sp. nanlin1 TaxID=3040605 RepID=UPI00388E3633
MKNPNPRYILITGAAGTGTTTLAQALANELRIQHLEADDFLWLPSDPPYQHMADKTKRGERLQQAMHDHGQAIVAGSIVGWGQPLENAFGLVVFLYLPAELRLKRLERREIQRFGQAKPEFLAWAAQYDQGGVPGRSLAVHNQWLAAREGEVLRLEGDMSVSERVGRVLDVLGR